MKMQSQKLQKRCQGQFLTAKGVRDSLQYKVDQGKKVSGSFNRDVGLVSAASHEA